MAEPGKPGRKAWQPTAQDRRTVSQLRAIGVDVADIAAILNVTPPTLRKHCWLDLERGRVMGRARNTKRLHQAAEKGNVTAMIWLDKTRFNVNEPTEPPKKELVEEESKQAPKGTVWEGLLQ